MAKIEAGNTPDPGFGVVSRLLAAAGATERELVRLWRASVPRTRPRAIGFGYEGLDQAGLIQRLCDSSVEVVADVRLTPLSRKPGLSKKRLAEALDQVGIQYVHLPALGNPKANRPGFADPANTEARARFLDGVRGTAGQEQIARLKQLTREHVVGVLCFESDERLCHRAQILAALS